ncbi:MAG: hypothetical protein V1909_01785 [Candidatus Micrarchaeota archaeon]
MVELDEKTEGGLAILSAILVILTAVLNMTSISLGIGVLALVSLGAYMYLHASDADKKKGKK